MAVFGWSVDPLIADAMVGAKETRTGKVVKPCGHLIESLVEQLIWYRSRSPIIAEHDKREFESDVRSEKKMLD
jgi:hypothetical protein